MNTNGMDSIFLARTLSFTFIICVIVIVIGIIIAMKITKGKATKNQLLEYNSYKELVTEQKESNKQIKEVFTVLKNKVSSIEKRQYVSKLARMLNISRPLLYMHLRKLESAKLIKGSHEISEDDKAMKYYEIQEFDLHVNPDTLFEFSKSVTIQK